MWVCSIWWMNILARMLKISEPKLCEVSVTEGKVVLLGDYISDVDDFINVCPWYIVQF